MIENKDQNLNQENERNQSGNSENRTENRSSGSEQRIGFQQQEREEGTIGRGESSRSTGLGEESEAPSELENTRSTETEENV